MHPDVERILFSQEQIVARCEELGAQITKDYAGNPNDLLVVGILKGSLPFMAELMKHIGFDFKIDFIAAASYAGTNTCGDVRILKDLDSSAQGRDILIIEDIIDTGLTLKEIKELLYHKGAHDVKICTLLDKKARRDCEVESDYNGFEIENEFVIGFGLDYNQKYRNLPYIGVIKPSAVK